MDEDIAEEVLLFILLRRCRRGENVRKSVKSQETFFVKGSNMEKIAVESKMGTYENLLGTNDEPRETTGES